MKLLRNFGVLIVVALFPLMTSATNANALRSYQTKNSGLTSSSQVLLGSTNSVLADIRRYMEPALTDFLSTYIDSNLVSTMVRLEKKYRSKRLNLDYNISKDAKLFVVIELSGKRYCYRGTGEYRIRLISSKRCA